MRRRVGCAASDLDRDLARCATNDCVCRELPGFADIVRVLCEAIGGAICAGLQKQFRLAEVALRVELPVGL